MHRLLSVALFLAVLLLPRGHALGLKRGLLQFSPEEQAALDNLSTVFAGGSSSSSSSSSSSTSSSSPPTPSRVAAPPPQQESPPPPPPPPPSPTSSSSSSSSTSSPSPPTPSTFITGARFTPAPADFTKLNLPTFSKISQTSGPISPDTLNSAAPTSSGSCKSIKDVLSEIPQVSQWLDLLNSAGYDSVLLDDTNAQATLFVPINSAFNAAIDAEPLRKEKTMQELVSNAPDVRAPLAGYSGTLLVLFFTIFHLSMFIILILTSPLPSILSSGSWSLAKLYSYFRYFSPYVQYYR